MVDYRYLPLVYLFRRERLAKKKDAETESLGGCGVSGYTYSFDYIAIRSRSSSSELSLVVGHLRYSFGDTSVCIINAFNIYCELANS